MNKQKSSNESKIAILSRDLDQEQDDLDYLVENLEKTTPLRQKMVNMLASFDERLTKLEGTILPIQQSTQNLTKIYNNITITTQVIEKLIRCFNLGSEKELEILKGPQVPDIGSYFKIVHTLKDAHAYLSNYKFKSCEAPQAQLYGLIQISWKKSLETFQDQLKLVSQAVDPTEKVYATSGYELIPAEKETLLTEFVQEIILLGKQYPELAAPASLSPVKTLYIQTRSQYLQQCLERLWQLAANDKRMNSYVKGSSGLITYLKFLLKLIAAEKEIASRIFTNTEAGPSAVFQSCVAPAVDDYTEAGEAFVSKLKRNMSRQDFADIFVLLDVTERIGGLLEENSGIVRYCGVKGAELIELYTHCNGTLSLMFKELFLDTLNPGAGSSQPILASSGNKGLSGPATGAVLSSSGNVAAVQSGQTAAGTQGAFFLPTDGTVHEITSTMFSYLKKLLEYRDFITECFSEKPELWATPQSAVILQMYLKDGNILMANSTSPQSLHLRDLLVKQNDTLARFYADILEALVLTLEQKSKLYPKKESNTFIVFMLNNCNYILKTLKSASNNEISVLLGKNIFSAVEKLVAKLRDDCLALWQPFVSWLESCISMKAIPELALLGSNVSSETALNKSQRQAVKDLFKSFNLQFEAIITSFSRYSIPDEELKSALKSAIKSLVFALATKFFDRFSVLNFTKHPEKHLKYDKQLIEQNLNKIFECKL